MNNELIANGFTLSPQQKLNWLENKTYHNCLVDIPEKWTKEGFLESIGKLFYKHEILRTRLEKVSGMEFPLQVIEPKINSKSVIDLSHLLFVDKEEILHFLKNEKTPEIDVVIKLFRTSNHKKYVSFSLSGFICDTYSIAIILNDIEAIYHKTITDTPLQYADLSEWLNGILEEKNEYWYLKENPPKIEDNRFLIGDRNEFFGSIPTDIKRLLVELEPSKIKMLLFVCWQYLLQCHFNNDTNSFIASSGRNLPELDGVLGCLEKWIPFVTLNTKWTINKAISELENQWLQRLEWEHDIPMDTELVGNQSALFRFTDNAINKSLKIVWQNITGESRPVTLSIFKLNDDIQLQLVSTLSEKKIQYLMNQYFLILSQALINQNVQLNEINLVANQEFKELLKIGSGKPVKISNHDTIHDLFEKQVLQTPNAIAIETETISISYSDLNYKSNGVAKFLETFDDDFIGLYCDRSIEMITAMLGVLKAGKAYVPLEPTYPIGRINTIIETSKLKLVLCHSETSLQTSFQNVLVKKISDITFNVSNFKAKKASQKNAYVLFTSGSSGKPKGVSVGHLQLVNHMKWMAKAYPLGVHDKILQRTPFGFDASVWEILAPLLQGAKLTLLPIAYQHNVHQILGFIKEKEITNFQVVPSLLNLMLQEADKTVFEKVKTIFCGGEMLQGQLATKVLNVHNVELVNLYGPTECTIQVSHHRCIKNSKTTPIGKPIDGVRFYILNKQLQLQPFGVKGELYIAGNCVSNGYFNEPEMTNEAFVEDCFYKEKKSFMYRSGDIAYWNELGELEIAGRIDDQIKLRGYRIELNEIDSVIMEHEQVTKSVTIVVNEDQLQSLICFYATVNNQSIKQENLIKLAKSKLAEYMIPTHAVFVETMPLTSNGKIDKNALRKMDLNTVLNNRTLVEPRNIVEEQLLIIWKALLKQNTICTTDNFFQVGGHSLLAVNLATSIFKKMEFEFPLSAVFDYPTIQSQAAFLLKNNRTQSCLVNLNKGDNTLTPLFLCAPTGGLTGSYFKLSQLLGNRPVFGLQDPGLNRKGVLYKDIYELSEIFAKEILSTHIKGSVCLGGWSFGGIVALETAKILSEAGMMVEKIIAFDSYAPLQKKLEPKDSQLYVSVARLLANLAGDILPEKELDSYCTSTNEEGLTRLLQLAIKGDLLPENASNSDMLLLFNVFKNNVTVLNKHVCTPHSFELHLFEPIDEVPAYLRTSAFERTDECASTSWEKLGKLKAYKTTGHHLNMLAEPNVRSLGTALQDILNN
jgi:amino acid adenylation domain-containing protein